MAVHGLDELIGFIGEMAIEDYPHSRTPVCKAIDNERNNFEDFKRIGEELRDQETTLRAEHDKIYFNHHDIT